MTKVIREGNSRTIMVKGFLLSLVFSFEYTNKKRKKKKKTNRIKIKTNKFCVTQRILFSLIIGRLVQKFIY